MTLKPPYGIIHRHLLSAIWDTSHWIFLSNLDSRQLETFPMTSMTNFEIYQLLDSPGPFKYFWQIGCLQKINFFLNEGVTTLQLNLRERGIGGQVPRLYDGTILGAATHLGGSVGHQKQRCFLKHL